MTEESPRRPRRLVGWLLTPLAAWAVAFLGAWIGALVAGRLDLELVGNVLWLAGGAVAGAVIGVGLWVWVMKRVRRER